MKEAQYRAPVRVGEVMAELFHEGKKRRSAKVLDVGAGTGLCGQVLHELGFSHIDAIDGSAMSLELSKARGVYQHIYPEVLVKGEKIESLPESTYDALVSAGAFYPGLMDAEVLRSLLYCMKKGGKMIIVSSHHGDEGDGMRQTLKQMESEGLVEVKREEYMPIFYQNDEGILWEMVKMHGKVEVQTEE